MPERCGTPIHLGGPVVFDLLGSALPLKPWSCVVIELRSCSPLLAQARVGRRGGSPDLRPGRPRSK